VAGTNTLAYFDKILKTDRLREEKVSCSTLVGASLHRDISMRTFFKNIRIARKILAYFDKIFKSDGSLAYKLYTSHK
jgi:hypothetical protein